jgi:hypothetical protein
LAEDSIERSDSDEIEIKNNIRPLLPDELLEKSESDDMVIKQSLPSDKPIEESKSDDSISPRIESPNDPQSSPSIPSPEGSSISSPRASDSVSFSGSVSDLTTTSESLGIPDSSFLASLTSNSSPEQKERRRPLALDSSEDGSHQSPPPDRHPPSPSSNSSDFEKPNQPVSPGERRRHRRTRNSEEEKSEKDHIVKVPSSASLPEMHVREVITPASPLQVSDRDRDTDQDHRVVTERHRERNSYRGRGRRTGDSIQRFDNERERSPRRGTVSIGQIAKVERKVPEFQYDRPNWGVFPFDEIPKPSDQLILRNLRQNYRLINVIDQLRGD